MAISLSLLLIYVITKKLKLPNKQILILAVLCGVLFASMLPFEYRDQNSSATQASLFVNSLLCGYYLYVFLTQNQQLTFGLERQLHYLEWLCWSVLNFLELDFDTAFLLPY
jgi:FtsH-binding integral membrane protein